MTRDEQIIELVRGTHAGMSAVELAELFHRSLARMQEILNVLCKAGTIARTADISKGVLYCDPKRRDSLIAERKRASMVRDREIRTERKRARRQREAQARAQARAVVADDADSWPVVQRSVSAADAPKIRRPAVVSVWDLAR